MNHNSEVGTALDSSRGCQPGQSKTVEIGLTSLCCLAWHTGRSAARRRPMGRGQALLSRPMGEVEGRKIIKMTPSDPYTWGFLGGTPGENRRWAFLLPCDSYTEANGSYLLGEQSHVLTNKDILKLGHIVNWGHQFHLQPQF